MFLNWVTDFFSPMSAAPGGSPSVIVLHLLVAFIVGQFCAWCYKWTHRGISYSRSFTQALILIAIAAALSMTLIQASPIAAVGLLGGLAIIRFRTVVRDARDNAYVLLCLICGMAAGLGYIVVAAIGAIVANVVAIYLYHTGFGAWRSIESLLRFQIEGAPAEGGLVDEILRRFCRRHEVVSVDEAMGSESGGQQVYQCVYKVRLRRAEAASELVSTLRGSGPIRGVHLLFEQENEEVD